MWAKVKVPRFLWPTVYVGYIIITDCFTKKVTYELGTVFFSQLKVKQL